MKRRLHRFAVSLIIAFLLSLNLYAQQTVRGTLRSPTGELLPGATVTVKGTSRFVVTGENGVFSINASPGNVLVISYIGYQTQEVTISSENNLNISMATASSNMEEVVVVGYGTLQRKEVTGSVVTVKTDQLPKVANASINNLLQGRAAGLNLSLQSAQPGGRLNVNIRGRGAPLYVIDGVPLFRNNAAEPGIVSFGSAVETGFSGGVDRDPLSNINPSDIESIDILKDASATAIYGSSASNGVILITTKKGKNTGGTLTTEYRGSYTVQTPKKYLDLLNAKEFMQQQVRLSRDRSLFLANAAPYGNAPAPAFTPMFTQAQIDAAGEGTDWLDLLMKDGQIHEHNISISGGSERTKVYASFNYYDNKAIVENSDFQRFTGRINLEQRISNRIKLSTNITGSQINSNNQATGPGQIGSEKFNALQTAYAFSPTLNVYDDNGKYTRTFNTQITNPAAFLIIQDKLRTRRLQIASNLEIQVLKDLKFNLVGGADKTSADRRFFMPAAAQNYLFPGGIAQLSTQTVHNYSLEGYATYNMDFSEHRLSILGGAGRYKNFNESFSMQGVDFFTDALGFNNIGLATNRDKTLMTSNRSPDVNKYSGFARINYTYKSKYIFTFNGRADASSNFAENNKWGFFPGVAFAWRASQESFLAKSKVISDFKLRIGYGEVGTDPGLNALTLYGTNGGTFVIGNTTYPSVALVQLGNPDLSWETLKQTNIGIDYELWQGRISGSLEFFRDDRINIIREVQVPYANAVTRYNVNNGGSQRRQGIEFTINTVNTQGKFRWESSLNLSTYNNRWQKRSPYDALNVYQGADDRTDIVYGWKAAGILQTESAKPSHMPNARPGNVIYVDQNGDNVLDVKDVVVLGYTSPRLIFGLGNRFYYSNFDLDIFLYGRIKENQFNNLSGLYAADRIGIPAAQNTVTEIKNVWSADNPTGTLPGIANNPYAVPTGATSDFYRQDVNYLRIRNITLGYTFKLRKLIRSARIFVDVQNVALWTNYKGYDPEIGEGNANSQSLTPAFGNPYPQTLSTTLGVNVSF